MSLPFKEPGDPADVKGSLQPTEQPDTYQFIKGQGWTTVKAWEGPTRGGIFGIAQELAATGYTNVRVSQPQPGVWRVEGSKEGQGDNSDPTDNDSWRLESIVEGRSIELHPLFFAVEDSELRKVDDAIENPSTTTGPALTDPNAITLYTLKLRKIDTYEFDVPVLVHNVTPGYEPDITGVRKIWTPDQIGVTTAMAANTVAALYANPPTDTPEDYTWGWLQMFPDLTEDVYGHSVLEERWILNFWHSDLFPTL